MAGINLLFANQLAKLPVVGLKKLYPDGDRLFLEVKPNSRRFVFRYKLAGKVTELPVGVYPARQLKEAREIAIKLREAIANGLPARHVIKPPAAPVAKTFRDYGAELIASKKAGWRNGVHTAQWPSSLEAYVYPLIGDKAPKNITVADVQAVLAPIWNTKNPTATKVQQRVALILDYAFVLEDIDRRNPARWRGNLDKLFPAARKVHKVKGHAFAPYAECPAIMAALRLKDSTSSRLLRFTILTASRPGNTLEAAWSEISLTDRVWVIKAAKMKADVEHKVWLSNEAMAILTEQAINRDPKSDYIFPGQREGRPMSDVACNKSLEAVYPNITVHGFRKSFRTWGAEQTSYPSEALELCLAHTNPNAVERIYQTSSLFDIRVKILADWAEYLS